jgi:microcystin-dependent protein
MRSIDQGIHGQGSGVARRLVSDCEPVGTVTIWPGAATSIPEGWLECDGSEVRIGQYPELYACCGTTYGAGSDAGRFKLPDLRGRVPIGAGQGASLTNRTLGATGGTETHALVTGEIPSHSHTMTNAGNVLHTGGSANQAATGTTLAAQTVSANASGSGTAHTNMMPFRVLRYIIRASPTPP